MPDAALSVTTSPVAALLATMTADAHATAQSADPFAALLASAVAPKANVVAATTASATDPSAALPATPAPGTNMVTAATPTIDPFATLAATQAPIIVATTKPASEPFTALSGAAATRAPTVIATPTATANPLPTPTAAKPALPVIPPAAPAPVPGAIVPIEAEAALPVTEGHADDDNDKPATKDDGADELADAIASGATAVLALAPTFVAPVQTPIPAEAPITIAIGCKVGEIAPGAHGAARFKAPIQATAAEADSTAKAVDAADIATTARNDAATTARNQADADSSQGQPQTARTPAGESKPATTSLSPEAVKAVIATLQQNDEGAPHAELAATVSPTAAAVAAAKAEAQSPQQPAVPAAQAQAQAAPAPTPPRRRSDEVAAPRRASDTRKRVETSTDTQPFGLPERATETTPAAPAGAGITSAPKTDALVQQTLAIAKDGAWLDKLAHDIANSAGKGNDLHFKLEPQNLGALTVAISQSTDGASIRMTADNDTTRNILLDAQPKLMAEARAQGLKINESHVDLDPKHTQNQTSNQDASRWAQGSAGQNATAQNGQNRQSSPGHQPFVSNLGVKADAESESPQRDSDALYA